MKIDIITLFPNMFTGPFDESMLWKAKKNNLAEINIHDLRQFGEGERRTVDDKPYGGGPGMLLRVDIVDTALKAIKKEKNSKIILMDAGGQKFNQRKAEEYSKVDQLIVLAGHYEGFDYRVHEHLVNEVISVGDFVLTGGEIPAMIITDAVVRLIPGVLGKEESPEIESHMEEGYIEYPQYTRPDEYNGWNVPEILKTGNHPEIEKWRKEKSEQRAKSISDQS